MDPRAAIAQILKTSARTLIVCHVNPDGDCLGAGLALAGALRSLGRAPVVASADGVPANLRFLPGAGAVVATVPPEETFDAAITIECSTLDRAGAIRNAIERAGTMLAVDHHVDHVPYAAWLDLDPTAAAVGEQIADLIARLGVVVDRDMAVNLLAALVTDTGAFRYANTTSRTLRVAADLLDRGASVAEIVRRVYESQPAASLRVLGRALAGLVLHFGGAVATTVLTSEMLADAGARAEDTSGIAAMLRTIDGVRLAMTFESNSRGIRVSIRSRDGVRADAVARALGGGGHPAAAGAEVLRPLDETVRAALDAARVELGLSE